MADINIYKPVSEALYSAIGSAFGSLRVFLADSVGQILVAVYTPFYCILDFIIAIFQIIYGLVEILFGWFPPHLFISILCGVVLVELSRFLRFLMRIIRGA